MHIHRDIYLKISFLNGAWLDSFFLLQYTCNIWRTVIFVEITLIIMQKLTFTFRNINSMTTKSFQCQYEKIIWILHGFNYAYKTFWFLYNQRSCYLVLTIVQTMVDINFTCIFPISYNQHLLFIINKKNKYFNYTYHSVYILKWVSFQWKIFLGEYKMLHVERNFYIIGWRKFKKFKVSLDCMRFKQLSQDYFP